MYVPGYSEEDKTSARKDLQQRFAFTDSLPGEQLYICGDTFTVAGACLFTIPGWTTIAGDDVSAIKNLQAFQTRVADRPSVKAAMKS